MQRGIRRRLPYRILQGLLLGYGSVAVGTGSAVMLFGTRAIPGGSPGSASTESGLRFYAAWWASAGALMAWVARDPRAHPEVVTAVGAVTVLGGLARVAAVRQTGLPHPLFRVLTVAELVGPPMMFLAYRHIGKDPDRHHERTEAGRRCI